MEDNFWDKCERCRHFEGYDMCLVPSNFGSVGNESLRKCEENNLFEEK